MITSADRNQILLWIVQLECGILDGESKDSSSSAQLTPPSIAALWATWQ
jgi:hypothetical protein